MKVLSDNIKKGRRALDALNEVKILQDWLWDDVLSRWYLKISIETTSTGEIPPLSNWFIVIEDCYPNGDIKVYPDIENSCKLTFEHQSNNGIIEKNGLWSKGALCLDVSPDNLVHYLSTTEPINVDERLYWHILRAIKWIESANSGSLTEIGDVFELPHFKLQDVDHMVFSEDVITYMQWESTDKYYGIAEIETYQTTPSIFYVKEFKTFYGQSVNKVDWGTYLSTHKTQGSITAIWIMFREMYVINNWQTPNTLGELIIAAEAQGLDLMEIIRRSASKMRDGRKHFLLLGCPIPGKIGEKDSRIHWQAISLPFLSWGKKVANGFRPGEKGWWQRDKIEILKPSMKLNWMKSQNWNMNEITARGKFDKKIVAMKVLIIGAGTIGASLSEILVRSGVFHVTIMDSDFLQIGNLSRHPLGFQQIGKLKAKEVSSYLNKITPHARTNYINKDFKYSVEINEQLEAYDLIIDCTGKNSVLDDIQRLEFKRRKIFVSASIGYAAKRLFVNLQNKTVFDFSDFYSKIGPHLEEEKVEFGDVSIPRDGVGCWSPVFPARYDDILLAVSTTTKIMENFIDSSENDLTIVYEKYFSDDNQMFIGYRKVD